MPVLLLNDLVSGCSIYFSHVFR